MQVIEERLDSLEAALEQFIRHVDRSFERQERFEKEMKDFKDEMKGNWIKAFKQWGDMANRLGTLAEDVVAPCVREIGEKYFGLKDEDDFMVRRFKRKKADKGKRREFDVICVYGEAVILAEVKSTPRIQYIDDFIKVLKEFDEYFTEYKGRKLIPIFASLYLPDEVIDYLTKNKIYAMAARGDMMDLLNFEKVP